VDGRANPAMTAYILSRQARLVRISLRSILATCLARDHHMQLWDCVVCAASIAAGAKVLLTEDMQDVRTIDGLRLINPFVERNAEVIEAVWRG
jgi:predicted nucleic acid-binding protein